jgi:hypothetical protein
MTKRVWKEHYRMYRIFRRMAEEQCIDLILYGSAFQLHSDYGIFNIPPQDVYYNETP